jgi:hypothetical protein
MKAIRVAVRVTCVVALIFLVVPSRVVNPQINQLLTATANAREVTR